MSEKKPIKPLDIILLAVVIVLVVALVFFYLKWKENESAEETIEVIPTPTPQVVVQEVETIVEVKAEITAEALNSDLNSMGKMTTAEYFFTGVASATKPPVSVLGLELGFTGAYYHAMYDGVVTAGVDFSEITVQKDNEKNVVFLQVPDAEIQSVEIDLESFSLITQQSSVFAHITPEDFNTSQIELEQTAKEKALEMGVLETANTNARTIILQFVQSLVGPEYTISFSPLAN